MQQLDVELVELPFNCCGYPSRNDNLEISILSSIKNLAIAQNHGLDIIIPCKCCFGQFRHALFRYNTSPGLKKKLTGSLPWKTLHGAVIPRSGTCCPF